MGVASSLLGHGEPLSATDRGYFEPLLGHDLEAVRVHVGPLAAAATQVAGAAAFAVGPHLAFGPNRYRPDTPDGRRLLTHELIHTMQADTGSGPPTLLTYEGPEHRYLGDQGARDLLEFLLTPAGESWARSAGLDPVAIVAQLRADPHVTQRRRISVRRGLDLSPGEIIALAGDLYEGPGSLRRAEAGEVTAILHVLDEQETGRVTGAEANVQFEQITKGRFTELARHNVPHFAPENRESWRRLHVEAMDVARTTTTPADLDQAYLIDAVGGHFLTDAFAAGHLLSVRDVEAAIAVHLARNPVDTSANPEMTSVVAALQASGVLIKLVLKNVHDRMNREGFPVRNARGMSWRTYGDDYLHMAPETRRIAALAVFLSRQQVTRARGGETPDPDDVLHLLPDEDSVARATEYAVGLIPSAASGPEIIRLIHANAAMLRTLRAGVPGVGRAAEALMWTISSPSRGLELERARELGGVAPQFTVLRW